MVVRNLPLFTYGVCVWKDKDSTDVPTVHPVGFQAEDEDEDKEKNRDK